MKFMHYKLSAKTYFIFAFSWSILFWFATVYFGGIEQFPGSLLLYVGGAGPIVAALILLHLREDRSVQKEFWVSTFDLRRMSVNWFLIALLVHPLLVLGATIVDVLLGGEIETKTGNLTSISAWITMIVFVFVFGPLPEEMGWRGVALDRLQSVLSPLNASLLLGAIWSIWHLPRLLFQFDGPN